MFLYEVAAYSKLVETENFKFLITKCFQYQIDFIIDCVTVHWAFFKVDCFVPGAYQLNKIEPDSNN